VIWREACRAIRVRCEAQGAEWGAAEIELADTLALQRYGLLAFASRILRRQESAPANP
jgi:hypothetical protein